MKISTEGEEGGETTSCRTGSPLLRRSYSRLARLQVEVTGRQHLIEEAPRSEHLATETDAHIGRDQLLLGYHSPPASIPLVPELHDEDNFTDRELLVERSLYLPA